MIIKFKPADITYFIIEDINGNIFKFEEFRDADIKMKELHKKSIKTKFYIEEVEVKQYDMFTSDKSLEK